MRTPVRAPKANGVAQRWVRTVRSECLDWILILSGRHLEAVLKTFIDHYNHHRPHRSLGLQPGQDSLVGSAAGASTSSVRRHDRLGGLIHEYYEEAA